jgi:NAD(P)-dependent dehydrogenase (short-subunit alcohol dehydrogenase family)
MLEECWQHDAHNSESEIREREENTIDRRIGEESGSAAGLASASQVEWRFPGGEMSGTQKVVLITGGTEGLGKAAAVLLAERGYRVFAAGRSERKRQELDAFAAGKKLSIETVEMDVCNDASVTSAVQGVLQKAGAIDVLVNNAGIGYMAAVEELRLEDLRRQFETNLFGVLRVTQAVLPHMRDRKRGRILMMSSVAGLIAPPTYGAYSSSKFALEGLSSSLRLELYPFGIEVILIEPGYIVTSFQQTAKDLAKEYVEAAPNGPYAKVYAGAWVGANKGRESSKTTPEDCARVMLDAIEASNPKARYPVTALAKWAAFGKRILPDAVIDILLRRKFGIKREA